MSSTVIPAGGRDSEVITLVGLAHGTSHFFHLVLPPLYPWLMRDLDLTFTQVGALMSVFFVVSGIGQALAGFVVDRAGARPVLFFGVATLAVSGVAVALADRYEALLFAAAIAGLGNSVFHPADFTMLNHKVRPQRLGHAFSAHGLSGYLGWAIAPVVMVAVAQTAGWQTAGLVASCIAITVLAILVVRRDVLADAVSIRASGLASGNDFAMAGATAFSFLAVPAVWLCLMFFFLSTAAFAILQNYGPSILTNLYSLDLGTAALTITVYALGSAMGTLVGGFFAAPGRRMELVIGTAMAGSACLALVLSSAAIPSWTVFPAIALMGFGLGMVGPSRDLLVRQVATNRFGKASFGRVYGFVYSGLDLGFALSPLLIGPLLDARQFGLALVAFAAFNALSIGVAFAVGGQQKPNR